MLLMSNTKPAVKVFHKQWTVEEQADGWKVSRHNDNDVHMAYNGLKALEFIRSQDATDAASTGCVISSITWVPHSRTGRAVVKVLTDTVMTGKV